MEFSDGFLGRFSIWHVTQRVQTQTRFCWKALIVVLQHDECKLLPSFTQPLRHIHVPAWNTARSYHASGATQPNPPLYHRIQILIDEARRALGAGWLTSTCRRARGGAQLIGGHCNIWFFNNNIAIIPISCNNIAIIPLNCNNIAIISIMCNHIAIIPISCNNIAIISINSNKLQ